MPVDAGSETNIKIGDVLYDNQSQKLIQSTGEEIYLRSQSAMVLKHLASQLNEMVTRDDLIASVWGEVSVTNDSLTQCIADIRRALGDHDKSILCTIPKRGYRLIGRETRPAQARNAVSAADPEGTVTVSDSTLADPYAARLDSRDILPTLAVLPFQTVEDNDAKVFSTVLGNEVTRQLCSFPDINVISSFSTGLLGGALTDPDRILDRLNADFILTGNLLTRGGDAVVSLEFIDTKTEFVLWSDRIQMDFEPMNPEIAEANLIVNRIRRAIMRHEMLRVASTPLGELKRFSLLYGAVGLMYRFSPKDFMSAKGLLDHLIEQAPNHPAPLAWLARWHVLNTVQGWASVAENAHSALQLTARALDIDPHHTHALVCEGQALVHLAQRMDDAEMRYDSALIDSPNDAQGRILRGMLLAFSDRAKDAVRDTERALHLTPRDPHRFFYLALASGACIAAEDYDRAALLAKESLRLNPTHISTIRMLAVAQLGSGDGDGGRATAKILMEAQPDLRISAWLKSSPSSQFVVGKRFANMMRELGVPE